MVGASECGNGKTVGSSWSCATDSLPPLPAVAAGALKSGDGTALRVVVVVVADVGSHNPGGFFARSDLCIS